MRRRRLRRLIGRDAANRYARWRWRGIPEGAWPRDRRLLWVSLYRNQRATTLNRRIDCVRATAREILGMRPRFYARRHPDRPWGHGYYDVEDLISRCRPWARR